MEANTLITTGLPIALFIVMIGMGLALTPADFRRVIEAPRAVLVGSLGQLLLLPALGFAVAALFNPASGVLAAGLVLVALCPGGTTSNLISYLARADLALSISLTMLSSLLTIFSIPLLLNLALELFTGEGEVIRLPFVRTLLTLSSFVLLPTLLGMALRAWRPTLAQRLEPLITKFSTLVLIAIVGTIYVSNRENLADWLAAIAVPALVLNLLAFGGAWLLATGARIAAPQRLTIMVELGLQNVTVAALIGLTLLGKVELVIPGTVYALLMYGPAAAIVAWGRSRTPIAAPGHEPQAQGAQA